MIPENIGYILLLLIASILTCMLSAYTYIKARGKPGVKAYVWLALASSIYAFGYAFELAGGSLQNILFWLKVQYLAIPIIPVLCLIMSLSYTGLERYLKRNIVFGLFLIPVLTYVIYYTNSLHHLHYTSVALRTDEAFPMVSLGKGFWYWVHISYSYLCILGAILLLIRRWHRSAYPYRMQTLSMSLGMFLPLLGNFIYLIGESPSGIDLAPMMMTFASPFHAAALMSFRMFNLVPVARGKVFESMRDGVIVLDDLDRIVDFNPASVEVFPALTPKVIGKHVQLGLKEFPDLWGQVSSGADEFDIRLEIELTRMYFQVRISPILKGTGEHIGRIMVLNNITERVQLLEHLRTLATFDGLTQIYNRAHLMEECRKELDNVKRQTGPISVIMMDIDHFKSINDHYGHEVGDIVIQQIVHTCNEQLQQGDIFGRYGGEEFVICLPFTDPQRALEWAEQVRIAVAAQRIQLVEGEVATTASFGVAGRNVSTADLDMALLLREADKALYIAKERGRNRVESIVHEEPYSK
ncbi:MULTISPECIES: histidine kinase N-terminal 7TM domain-containing protein [unclassified Paenibacillus]|uniref:histidine kinase N-terminal 7TM domain-containing diguanylate cyclase n=1 Tax=unclassified Paenibacillus TaxID=185978 RepID=UPI001AE6DDE1|nr:MULTISPECIES: histidine kinase N-terminal 7TM domain-containing protein [unclassified Paenibacillus]MBP1155868.1 diguanylate cyclase (GGDEF)-like protein [Paenibacillus sp. PvP091]MBP1168746.1 diguanylate cyclase (GGDEF)-like protein [Paenibacillus sp. PvR098]MBP2439774.1 diguanylate cyclase (GGDEF)-like protein [Paenibacillus sp. PvP052]